MRILVSLFLLAQIVSCDGSSPAPAPRPDAGGADDTHAAAPPDLLASDTPAPQVEIADDIDSPSSDVEPIDACVADCLERECGDDGCGGSCGDCSDGHVCSRDGVCFACTPDCGARVCGGDGCGGVCGECADNEVCNMFGRCQCVPDCSDVECGDDGCGGSCGDCPLGWVCADSEGACHEPCIPDCREGCCGEDGCGGLCAERCAAIGLICDTDSCGCTGGGPCALLPELVACDVLAPEPSTPEDVAAYYLDYAVPLYCDGEAFKQRDVTVFGLDAGDVQLFMFGEVHGSHELGRMSADIFELLVRKGRVNTLTMEIGVDMSAPLDEFVRTGGGMLGDAGWLERLPRGMFIRTLVERARLLTYAGYPLFVFGADIPMLPSSAVGVVERLSDELSETRDHVLPLPAVSRWGGVDRNEAREWRDSVLDHRDAICDELGDSDDCEWFVQYTNAVWLSAVTSSGALQRLSPALQYEFFSRREEFIYFVYRTYLPDESFLIYSHMGAAHTAKVESERDGFASAAARLDADYPVTAGRIYSTTPAYGPNSRIRYGGEIYDLPAEPWALSRALESAPITEYQVSTWRPSSDCVKRPHLGLRSSQDVLYSEAYDAFTWIRQLTPESGGYMSEGGTFKSTSAFDPAPLILERRDAIAAARANLRRSLKAD